MAQSLTLHRWNHITVVSEPEFSYTLLCILFWPSAGNPPALVCQSWSQRYTRPCSVLTFHLLCTLKSIKTRMCMVGAYHWNWSYRFQRLLLRFQLFSSPVTLMILEILFFKLHEHSSHKKFYCSWRKYVIWMHPLRLTRKSRQDCTLWDFLRCFVMSFTHLL